jgi:hypothetical protein
LTTGGHGEQSCSGHGSQETKRDREWPRHALKKHRPPLQWPASPIQAPQVLKHHSLWTHQRINQWQSFNTHDPIPCPKHYHLEPKLATHGHFEGHLYSNNNRNWFLSICRVKIANFGYHPRPSVYDFADSQRKCGKLKYLCL